VEIKKYKNASELMTVANYFTKLSDRLLRKVATLPVVRGILLVSNDKLSNTQFLSNTELAEAQYATYQSCEQIESYFQFSNRVFGSQQIKSEILNFLEFANTENPKVVSEIGTADGGTNFLLSQAISSVDFMVGIDLYVKNREKLRYFSKQSQTLGFINGSSRHKAILNKVKSLLEDRKLDLLFIDGDHTYEGVKQDFLNYRQFVREGGIIAFHDIVPDYLTRYGINTGRWVGEVPRFWQAIKHLYETYEFVENPEQDGLGIGALRYSSQVVLPDNL
jgi:cephalosporin hydroxylase